MAGRDRHHARPCAVPDRWKYGSRVCKRGSGRSNCGSHACNCCSGRYKHGSDRWMHGSSAWKCSPDRWMHGSSAWNCSSDRWMHGSGAWNCSPDRWMHGSSAWNCSPDQWMHGSGAWNCSPGRSKHGSHGRKCGSSRLNRGSHARKCASPCPVPDCAGCRRRLDRRLPIAVQGCALRPPAARGSGVMGRKNRASACDRRRPCQSSPGARRNAARRRAVPGHPRPVTPESVADDQRSQ